MKVLLSRFRRRPLLPPRFSRKERLRSVLVRFRNGHLQKGAAGLVSNDKLQAANLSEVQSELRKRVQHFPQCGVEVGQNTLLRFYVLHVILLPLTAAIFLAVHFWRIRKDGGISGPL